MITIITEDKKEVQVDKRIRHISKLFEVLLSEYDLMSEDKGIVGITYADVEMLNKFGDACGYEGVTFEKPLWLKGYDTCYEEMNTKMKKFVNEELTCDKIKEYIRICGYYGVDALEEVIVWKLGCVFSCWENINNYFNNGGDGSDKCKGGGVLLSPVSKEELSGCTKEQMKMLKQKYDYYVMHQLDMFSDKDIEELCYKFYS